MTIDEFRDAIMNLKPGNFMALNGAASGIIGSSNSGADVMLELQRATIDFVHQYKTGDDVALEAATQELRAKLMVATTVGAITEGQSDMLTDNLMQIMNGEE